MKKSEQHPRPVVAGRATAGTARVNALSCPKLSLREAAQIRKMAARRDRFGQPVYTQAELAELFGVSWSHVSKILRNLTLVDPSVPQRPYESRA